MKRKALSRLTVTNGSQQSRWNVRYYAKPNVLQANTSFVVVDPNVSIGLDGRKQMRSFVWTLPDRTTLVDKAHEALDTPAFTNRMLLFFIERIDIHAGMKVEIHYRFKDELEQFIICNE